VVFANVEPAFDSLKSSLWQGWADLSPVYAVNGLIDRPYQDVYSIAMLG
jgi:hypothetical protein